MGKIFFGLVLGVAALWSEAALARDLKLTGRRICYGPLPDAAEAVLH